MSKRLWINLASRWKRKHTGVWDVTAALEPPCGLKVTENAVDRAEILDWRNDERIALVRSIEEHRLELSAKIDEIIDNMSMREMLDLGGFHDAKTAPVVEKWLAEQYEKLRHNVKSSAIESEQEIGHQVNDFSWSWDEILGVGAGALLTAAPFAAGPLVASIATVTTTSFVIFTTATVSIPILSVAIAGTLVTGMGGNAIRGWTTDKIKNRYRTQTKEAIRRRAIGDPAAPETPSLCRKLLAEIDAVTRKRLEDHQ